MKNKFLFILGALCIMTISFYLSERGEILYLYF